MKIETCKIIPLYEEVSTDLFFDRAVDVFEVRQSDKVYPVEVQERQFYEEFKELVGVDEDRQLEWFDDRSMLLVTEENLTEIADFLRNAKTVMAFHLAIVEDEAGSLYLMF